MLIPCAAKWKLIGTLLKINHGHLKNFEANMVNAATAPQSYFMEMLVYWTKNMPGTTVGALCDVLVGLNERELAENLLQTFS